MVIFYFLFPGVIFITLLIVIINLFTKKKR